MTTILCIDDEPATGALFDQLLTEAGYEVILASTARGALEAMEAEAIDLILTDDHLPGLSGLELLRQMEERPRKVPVVIVTGLSSVADAVLLMRGGAVDYLTKPVRSETLLVTVRNALEYARLRNENESFRTELSRIQSFRRFIGRSRAVKELLETVATVAPTRASVLLEGESGTGKELLARAIHEQSTRRDQPFVTVNCAALPEGLVESVLFGHEKGAFTGAGGRALGAFERADGGTLMLDEISEMRLDLQAKLLRAIQEQEFERVGGRESIRVNVRLIATTNRDLFDEVRAGRFRADLYYRIQVVPIRTPPLRERLEDIPVLLQHFLRKVGDELGLPIGELDPETVSYLQAYSWPGNVRELANSVERSVIFARGGQLTPEVFAVHLRAEESQPSLFETGIPMVSLVSDQPWAAARPAAELPFDLPSLEQMAIERALHRTGGNRTRAAKLLGISERTLRYKLNTPSGPLTDAG